MIPVFPLDIVILPEEEVALHIFEPRYQQLYANCKNGEEFVIVYTDRDGTSKYGTSVFIDKVINEFPDGTIDIIVKGKEIISIEKFISNYPNKLYAAIEGKKLIGKPTCSNRLKSRFEAYLKSIDKTIKRKQDYSLFYIANRLELTQESKNNLIGLFNFEKMDLFLLNEIIFLKNIRNQEATLKNKFHLN